MKGKVLVLLVGMLGLITFPLAEERGSATLPCEEETSWVENPELDEVVAGFSGNGVESETRSKIILWDEAKKMDVTRRSSRKLRIEINY